MDKVPKLTIPDFVSLFSLFLAWTSILLAINGEPNLAIFINLFAVALDFLDGFLARKLHQETVLGKQIDSFADVFTYLVFSIIIFSKFLSPTFFISIIIGFAILVFGGLRLIRFNDEGMLKDKNGSYYRGIPVFFIGLLTLICYVFSKHIYLWNPMLTTLFMLGVSPFMLSNIKINKTRGYLAYITILFILLLLVLI